MRALRAIQQGAVAARPGRPRMTCLASRPTGSSRRVGGADDERTLAVPLPWRPGWRRQRPTAGIAGPASRAHICVIRASSESAKGARPSLCSDWRRATGRSMTGSFMASPGPRASPQNPHSPGLRRWFPTESPRTKRRCPAQGGTAEKSLAEGRIDDTDTCAAQDAEHWQACCADADDHDSRTAASSAGWSWSPRVSYT
jgi:hypothetical protein